jgi:DNA topoisomerase I
MDLLAEAMATAKAVKLRYVKSGSPGYTRAKKGKNFYYLDQHGGRISDEETLKRIRGLVLPPAWQQVWISPHANGHLQATGIDTKGRRQYRYHNTWAKVRNETKYDRLLHFGEKLPQLREHIEAALRKHVLDKEKVTAIALSVMQETLMRVGNTSYEKLYGSYGLTTLRDKHVKITGNTAFFHFKGKKGVMHQITLKHAQLAKLLRKVSEIPGHELFQYYEGDDHKCLDSGDINEFLKLWTGEDFTCKDFRTWSGTVNALNLLADLTPFSSATECKQNLVGVIDGVAGKLGNTRTVCKKYYIHPKILESYEKCELEPYLSELRAGRNKAPGKGLHNDEKVLLKFMKTEGKKIKRRLLSA